MDIQLLKEQNPWWIAKEKINDDVNLEKLNKIKYVRYPRIIDSFDMGKDLIYTLRGSRQVGKTTAMKLLIKKLLQSNPKENIFYFTCNNIDTYKELLEIMEIYLDWADNDRRKYIFVDEITFVDRWTRAIKHLADMGRLRKCAVILTGSNAHDLKYEVERMPGRRGEDADLDKILFPVSFKEYVAFADSEITSKFLDITEAERNYPFYKKELRKLLNSFLITGGFAQSINNFVDNGKIGMDVYQQYLSWILGDLAKLGRKESYSRQIFEQIITVMRSNVGYDTIAKKTTIDSHVTVASYLDAMESSFILKILYQIDIDKKVARPRRTKKIYFQDLFLFWVFYGYVYGFSDYFSSSNDRIREDVVKSKVIENLVMSDLMRLENSVNWSNMVFFFRSTNNAEVDFVARSKQGELLPIEVKYQNHVKDSDFLNLNKVNNRAGVIVSKDDFRVKNSKFIMPAEVFLLLDNREQILSQ